MSKNTDSIILKFLSSIQQRILLILTLKFADQNRLIAGLKNRFMLKELISKFWLIHRNYFDLGSEISGLREE